MAKTVVAFGENGNPGFGWSILTSRWYRTITLGIAAVFILAVLEHTYRKPSYALATSPNQVTDQNVATDQIQQWQPNPHVSHDEASDAQSNTDLITTTPETTHGNADSANPEVAISHDATVSHTTSASEALATAIDDHEQNVDVDGVDSTILSNVWQLFLAASDHDSSQRHNESTAAAKIPSDLTASWYPVDGSWTYNFIGSGSAEAFVKAHFRAQPDVISVFSSVYRPVIRSDYMRYLLLAGAGGVYADTDTRLLEPLQDWIPTQHRARTRAVIGIEFDKLDGPKPESKRFEVSFGQYVFAAAKGHPIMARMVRNITDAILGLAEERGEEVGKLQFTDKEVLEITGPRGFTPLVYQYLSEQMGEEITWRNVTGLKEPTLFGDTLILPINGFGSGQRHSGSSDEAEGRLVRHAFSGRWRGGKDKGN